MLSVCETFSSIQGESLYAGRPCFFIRLAGCSLSCSYCDTGYAKAAGTPMTVEELLELAHRSSLNLVEVTGGEPMEQKETPLLCRRLLDEGFEVLLETNGAMPLEDVPEGVVRIIDYKLPSSGMAGKNCLRNFADLRPGDEIKFVVGSRDDFDCAVAAVKKYGLEKSRTALLVSPVWGRVELHELADWVLRSGVGLRLQLQMHKIIWGDRRGV